MAQAVSVPSNLLTREENERVFSLVGPRAQCKATAVAQMFHAYPNPDQWNKFRTGVVCLVKDHHRRSYFIRLFDITVGALVFEQELYKEFVYRRDHSFFHSFEGDSFMVGLNFADEGEAFSFYQAVSPKLRPRVQKATPQEDIYMKREDIYMKRDDIYSRPEDIYMRREDIYSRPEEVYMRVQHPSRSRSQTMAGSRSKFSAASTRRKSMRVKPKAPKKEFQRLAMLGLDPVTGHFDANRIDPLWLKLLHSVGVTIEQLKDVRTATFIVDFVDKHGGIEEANRQLLEATRSPPASPGRSRAKSIMIRRGKSVRGRGQRPPAQHRGHSPPLAGIGSTVPAPPPPPSLQQGVPAPPPPPSVGVIAPHSAPLITYDSPQSQPIGRDLLSDIQAGLQLRPVDTSGRAPREKPLTGMLAALVSALDSRKQAVQHSDEDELEDDFDEEWDDWGTD